MDAFQDDFPGFSLDEVAGATDYNDFNINDIETTTTSYTRSYTSDWNPLEDPPNQMTASQNIFPGLGSNNMETSAPSDTKPPKSEPTPPPNATPTESKIQSAPVGTPNTDKNMDSDEQSESKDAKSNRASKSTLKNNKRRRGDDDEEYNPDAEEAKARKAKKKARGLRSVASPDNDSIPTTPTSTTSNYQRPKPTTVPSRGPTSPSDGPALKRKKSEEELHFGTPPMHANPVYPMHPAVGQKPPSVGPNGMPLSFSILQKSPPAASMMGGPANQRPPIEVHENVEQRVKELLEENAKIIATMGDNLVNASPHCNLDLMVRFRNNIFTLQKYLDYVPGTRTRLPPLPIKVNTFNFIRPDASNYAMMSRGMPNPANFLPSNAVINPTRI
eukprot:TRINITY_DN1801_c0_g1_i1.p1 TRINITY_DN1801_c0_g1~~TRINITY_DN1801_c0_g1_i1.p1  ORF type:complete len:387 (-),score=55.40 TRINITY_DN1801_c0_g1_i1:91-1251(-)